ncbi:msx2-interacting protein [Plakobranchus ocellatus]|uniref:Msx2-interacting protein n=1 Tax=Plakobranchus ocellatus TaxID=259542 RepID=A0AAV4DET8_9GAST|nr:msx2-interacting protein [Plakobranchus ocellatus]
MGIYDGGSQDKGDSNSVLPASGAGSTISSATLALDKSVTAFDIPRSRARDRFSKKTFGQKFDKSGSFGRHGTSSRSLEAARSQSEAAAAAAASASTSSATTAAASLTSVIASSSSSLSSFSSTATSSAAAGTLGVTSSSIASISSSNGPLSGGGGGLINHPVIVLTDGKDTSNNTISSSTSTNLINNNGSNSTAGKDSSSSAHQRDSSSMSRSRPHTGSPSSRQGHSHSRNSSAAVHHKSNSHRSRSGSVGSRSRSRSRGSRSSSSRSESSGTSRSTSPHRSFSSNTMRPQSMVGASRLVSSSETNKDSHNRRCLEDGSAGEGDRRALGICVTGLPMRSTDSSLRDGLYHEYKKHGKVTTVQIFGEGDNRCAVVSFRKPEDASKALEASQGKTFFGAKIKVTSHEGVEVDDTDRASDNDSMDEYHLKSTRTLFVGNLEKETTTQDLMDKFKQFGEIIDIDIKRQGATTAFAFVQYVDIASVVAALRAMEGQHIGINKIKLGFGKSMPTCCVWLDNIPNDTSSRALRNIMSRYGEITYVFVDRNRNKGLVCYSSYEDAQHCVSDIKLRPNLLKKKVQIDFASRECHTDFLDKMEESGQLRANERPDESRVYKFRLQRSVDNYQDDGSPSSYGFNSNRGNSSVFNTPRNNGRSSGSSSRRSRGFNDYPEENHSSSSRRSSRRDDFNQGGAFYSKSGDDYDVVLREYGHSQRERRERESPRRMDSQSRRGSRDVSLDRYEEQRSKDRNTSSLHNSRDTSPNSEHNSYRSESHRYRSSREEKYSSRGDRYMDDSKSENKDFDIVPSHSHRSSRIGSPQYMNSNSMHSHDSDYTVRRGSRAGSRGSRSQSPDVTLLDDPYSNSNSRMFYPEDYKRSVVTDDDLDVPYSSSKRRDVLDIDSVSSKSRSLALLSNNKLGAEVAKTAAEKNRKRSHEEISIGNIMDPKILRKLEKSSPMSGSDREKARHMFGKLNTSKRRSGGGGGGTVGSPGGISSGGSQGGGSENGSAGEDLQHLHQRKQILLMQIKELGDESGAGAALAGGIGAASDSDSPRLVKSVAVKDALRRSGRVNDSGNKHDDERVLSRSDKLRRSTESRRSDGRGSYYSSREDRTLIFDEETSLGGNHSDSDFDSEKQRPKKRRLEGGRDIESVKSKDYLRQGSVDISDSEDFEKKSDGVARLNSSTLEGRAGCDIRSNSLGSKHTYEDICNKKMDLSSPCDNGDFKDRLSDKDILVINEHQNSSKSNASYLSRKDWSRDHRSGLDTSPVDCFSPTPSDRGGEEDSITSSSLTEKSSKHPSSPPTWKHSPSASPVLKDNDSEPDLSYLNALPDPLDDDDVDDCLSDSSLVGGESLPGPGEASWEERIRAIDRVLNMAPSSKASADFSLVGGTSSSSSSLSGSKDAANNNDPSISTNLYAKYRIRKREEGVGATGGVDLVGDNGSVLEQPSVIVQRVLSKKSILDQDFKRLEQVNKYDTSSGIIGSSGGVSCGTLKDMPQLLLPSSSSSSLSVIKEEHLASPKSLGGKLAPPFSSLSSSPALSPSLNPVTTSSSVLQPTTTTSVAGSTLALSLSSSLSLESSSNTSAIGSSTRALTTSSVCTPISSISVSCENSGPKDLWDKSVKTSVVTVNNSHSISGSKVVMSQSSLLFVSTSSLTPTTVTTTQHVTHTSSSSLSSISVLSNSLITSSTSHTFNVQHTSNTSNAKDSGSPSSLSSLSLSNSSFQNKPVISSLPLPPSLLTSVTQSLLPTLSSVRGSSSNHTSHTTHSTSSNPSQTLTPTVSTLPSATCEAANGGCHNTPAAAPFTQGPPTKSQLVPTLGQEAPLLSSPVFDHGGHESSSASASCPRLPGDQGLVKTSTSGDISEDIEDHKHSSSSSISSTTTSRACNNPELTINLWDSKTGQACEESNMSTKASKSSALLSKPEVVTPDIESPVSVKSGTSSTDSVPLSSLDTKPCISVSDDRSLVLSGQSVAAENSRPLLKTDSISPGNMKTSTSLEKAEGENPLTKNTAFSNILGVRKNEASMPISATSATVLTVSSKDCPEKEEKLSSSELSQIAKGKIDSLSPSSSTSVPVTSDEDLRNSAPQLPKPSSSSSASSASTTSVPTTSVSSTRPAIEKSEKKTPVKASSKTATSGRAEALFAPDVKLEPPHQKSSSSSRDNNRHQSKDAHKVSSQSSSSGSKPSGVTGGNSSTSDKKSLKTQSSKDGAHGEKRDSTTSVRIKDGEKSDKPDSAHKTHDLSAKNKETDKNKMKDKRDQSKEGDKASRKEKDDSRKKEEKKPIDKKEEKKGSIQREEKKSEKKPEEKKEKVAPKQDVGKQSSSDQELSKKDKKGKEKGKESSGKDKTDKKLLPNLSCVSKHSSPEPKSESKSSKGTESKSSSKESLSSKSEKEKSDTSTSKNESKTLSKQDTKHKGEQKSSSKVSDGKSETKESLGVATSKKSGSDSSQKSKAKEGEKPNPDAAQKVKKEEDKQTIDSSQKVKKETSGECAQKSKKEGEKDASKQSSGKHLDKAQRQKQKEEERLKEKQRIKEQKEKEEKERKDKEEREKQREREEKEKQKEKEREEKERQKEKEREEKERQRAEREKKEKEEKERKEREEKERLKREREEKEKQKEKEREERERQKEKEREERERQKEKEKEEKEKKEREEKERLKKEKEEKEKAKQREREEKEAQKEKERMEKEKRENEEKERLKKEKERKEKKEKEKKKAKEEKLKKEKEAKAKKEKEEKLKKEREEKEKAKKEKERKEKEKEKEDKDEKKKPPPPKKQKRNELAALLDSNDRFQMTFTSMYDRVKTQRNRDTDHQPNKSPSSASQRPSADKFKQNRAKKGSKVKSSLYYSTSDLSDDDNLSETNESEDQTQKPELVSKDTKAKKTKQVKKRPRVSSSSSSSSCEDDDDALLSATKPKGGKKTDIFSSDSEDDNFPPPSVKSSKTANKSKAKPPAPKKKKVRSDSLDSVGSREEFVKPQLLSSVTETESLDDMDLSETESPKVSKIKKKKGKLPEKRDSSVESVSKKSTKAERDSSSESVVRKPAKLQKDHKTSKVDKEESPVKKAKTETKKSKRDNEEKTRVMDVEDKKMDVSSEDDHSHSKMEVKKEVITSQNFAKADSDKHKSKDKVDDIKGSLEKKKKKDREDGSVKKKKKKKYDPKEEEALVNSLITKVYDSKPDKERKKKKAKPSAFDIESDEMSLSETSLDISQEKNSSASGKDETGIVKQKDKKSESHLEREDDHRKDGKHIKAKHSTEAAVKQESTDKKQEPLSKKEAVDKKQEPLNKKEAMDKKQEPLNKKEAVDKKQDNQNKKEAVDKKQESQHKKEAVDKKQEPQNKKEIAEKKQEPLNKKEKEHLEKKQEDRKDKSKTKSEDLVKAELKAEPDTERSESGKPPKKKKKKDHDRDTDKDKIKGSKSSKSLSSVEKKPSDSQKGEEEEKKSVEMKTTQKDVDEFTSFWGHPKPILIPKRLKDSQKSEDDSSKSKEQKEDAKMDPAKPNDDAVKDEIIEEKPEKVDEVKLESPPAKTPDSVNTPKLESDTGEDFVVPISEAETTVVTENVQPASSGSISTPDSLVINEEQTPESVDDVTGDMTGIGSSVEINDDDDYPSLIIDEVSDTASDGKKKTKREKKQLKKQKDINDRLDEVIASVAMGGSSDEEDGVRRSPDVNLQDVIDEELKYDNKSSNEPETKSFIVSDFVFPDDKRKSELGSSFAREKAEAKSSSDTGKKEPEKKGFLLDEETKKRDEDLLKKLAVLCDPSVDKPVEIEDPKVKEEELKKKEEEEKRKAEEEKKKAEEEEKARREKEERDASDEAARAVESLLEFQNVFDDDLPPLFIEPAEKEPPVESVSMSPSKEKSDVSIFPGSIPEKVTANLDDKLLERKSSDKVFGETADSLGLFATPSQNTHVPVFTSPRRNSAGINNKDKTPEPVAMPSPQRQMRSPQRQQPPHQSPQLHSPQHRQMQSPQQGPILHSSPQKIQSPQASFMQSPQQKTLPSPQQHHPQSPSPQRPNQSPHRVGLQSPLLSPQRSPFFKDRSFISPGREALAACTFPQQDSESMPLVQQPQRRASSGLPVPPNPEHALDPHVARRKSQEFPVEQAFHSPRRNTIAAPEEAATSVAHLDRRFPHSQQISGGSSSVFFSKERSHSSLPQPVSISLDNAPHDKNYQSPMRSLTIPPHQENVLLSPKRSSPGYHHKEQHSLDQPSPFPLFQNKTSMPEQMFSGGPITSMANQVFSPGQQPKIFPQQDSLLPGGKGLVLDKGFKATKVPAEQQVFRSGALDKPLNTLNKDPLFLHQKGLHQEPHFQQGKEMHNQISESFSHPHNKPTAPVVSQQEPMFSPKTQPSSPYTYPEGTYDFLNSPPSKIGPGLGTYPLPSSEASQPSLVKPPSVSLSNDAYSQDPLFIAMSEASARPPDREPPIPRRQDGLPPSFYQEPVPVGPKPVFAPEINNMQPQFEDEKKGTRKRRRSNKKLPKEDKDAALAEQAIQEIVDSKLEQIHQVFHANQAKAAAEKAGSKKAVDAYDFEAHTGQESGDIVPRPAIADLHAVVGDNDSAKPLRMRNEGRGRGRGRGAGRGRRGGRGGNNTNVAPLSALQDKHQDAFQKSMLGSDPFNTQRRPGPEFPSQQQQQHPSIHPMDHHLQPHHEPPRQSGAPTSYHPPVSHHSMFPSSVSQPSPFSRQVPPHQVGGLPMQPGFPQQFYQPSQSPSENSSGAMTLQDLSQKPQHQMHQQPPVPSSPFQNLPPPSVSSSASPSVASAALPPMSQQPQYQPTIQLPQAAKPPHQHLQAPIKSDVLSPESNKQQDLDSSYGESELVINLDDQPPSIEGKENQYSLSSDGEDRSSSSMAPSPATPRSQRTTRTRKQPNYKAIAAGTAQQQLQGSAVAQSPGPPGRTSRSGGSPRGLRAPGSAGPPASPKSPRAASSSPVVKLEKLEVGGSRSTRRGRAGLAGSKEDLNASVDDNSTSGLSQASDDWKSRLGDGADNKPAPASKDSIYDFADNESDQQREPPTSLRPNQRRNKKRGVVSSILEPPDGGVDFMPGSPASSSNSSSLLQEPKLGSFDSTANFTDKPGDEGSTVGKSTASSLLSNVDAVIEAVAKGRFGDDEEPSGDVLPETPASSGDPALSPPQTRSSRRTSEAKKETQNSASVANTGNEQKAEKTTFSIAEAPRFDGREGAGTGRKGPTVPPLRIKVAHGTPKLEKEKHYVIASEHPQKPLSLTVKVAHKAVEGEGGRDLGLFSGLPQGDQGLADSKNVTSVVSTASTTLPSSTPQALPSWKAVDSKAEVLVSEDSAAPAPLPAMVTTRAGGAMHPKVAAKVQASQEAAAGKDKSAMLQASGAQQVMSCHPALLSKSSPSTSLPSSMAPVSGTPAHGPKHTWATGHHLEQLQQAATSGADSLPISSSGPSHLPPHLLTNSGGPGSPLLSPMARSEAASRPITSSHQDSKASSNQPPPSAHNQRNMGLAGKHAGVESNPDLVAKMASEAQKHHQSQFGFPGHVPPAHSGTRSSFLLGSEGQNNLPSGHSIHYPGPTGLRPGADSRTAKSPSLPTGQPPLLPQHKLGSADGRTRTPPVTSTNMLFSGVVSGIPRSLSPKTASPEGQVIERLPNPMRQGEQSPSPLSLRLPGSHHPDPGRFMKGLPEDHGRDPPPAHGEQRAPSRDLMFQQIMEHQRLQQHILMMEAARVAAAEGGRNGGPAPGGTFPPPNMRPGGGAGHEQQEGPGSRKGSLSGGSAGSQSLSLMEQESMAHRVTPKSTPPAPQSPFPPMSFMDQRVPGSVSNSSGSKPGDRLPVTVASAFMQPSPGGHPQHMYPTELSLAGLAATGHHSPFGMMGRLPMDHRGIYSPGGNGGPPGGPQGPQQQQAPPHMLREGLPSGHFPPFQRFDGKKGGDPGQDLGMGPPHGMLRAPSQSPSLTPQLQPADLARMSALGHDLPARDSPVGILQRFPVMWQGGLALKNESSYVQMHFIAGNRRLPSQALPQPLPNGGLPPLRISQRMRLEHSQLDGVAKRMQCEDDYCILIAVACGRDEHDINLQTRALNEGFITYLLSKQAAGIVNVPLPGSEQAGFVVHIFPPCEFVDNSVAQQGSEALMEQLRQVPHAVIIIATTFT